MQQFQVLSLALVEYEKVNPVERKVNITYRETASAISVIFTDTIEIIHRQP